ncbi:hypothetical protein GCM10009425_45320 [Pseudomonas asuensis]|uniref:Uncharacterized protein n=1 Tax=Pseudomonas asuensis TaxID=1825787 RepID=A0ABQ2H2T0_9PSED|nr:hypothetical protein GCM10009425_45320 [Pseudomonas asuensis]
MSAINYKDWKGRPQRLAIALEAAPVMTCLTVKVLGLWLCQHSCLHAAMPTPVLFVQNLGPWVI